jgi:hypothetical protein
VDQLIATSEQHLLNDGLSYREPAEGIAMDSRQGAKRKHMRCLRRENPHAKFAQRKRHVWPG